MNVLCDRLIADLTEARQDAALLTGTDSFNTIKEAKAMASAHGQFNGKATIAWRRGDEWLTFTFQKDEDCESGWAINVRWLADKPSWVTEPTKSEFVTMRVPRHMAYKVQQWLKEQEVAS